MDCILIFGSQFYISFCRMQTSSSHWRSWETPLCACLLCHHLQALLLSNLRPPLGIPLLPPFLPLSLSSPSSLLLCHSLLIRLSWTLSVDAAVLGYYIYRAPTSIQSRFTKITAALVTGRKARLGSRGEGRERGGGSGGREDR